MYKCGISHWNNKNEREMLSKRTLAVSLHNNCARLDKEKAIIISLLRFQASKICSGVMIFINPELLSDGDGGKNWMTERERELYFSLWHFLFNKESDKKVPRRLISLAVGRNCNYCKYKIINTLFREQILSKTFLIIFVVKEKLQQLWRAGCMAHVPLPPSFSLGIPNALSEYKFPVELISLEFVLIYSHIMRPLEADIKARFCAPAASNDRVLIKKEIARSGVGIGNKESLCRKLK
jgi:hypothetical protein